MTVQVGTIKPVLTLTELSQLLGISVRTLHKLRRTHAHPGVEELPRVAGTHPRFAGHAVERWLNGHTELSPRRRPPLSSHRQVRPQKLFMAKAGLRSR